MSNFHSCDLQRRTAFKVPDTKIAGLPAWQLKLIAHYAVTGIGQSGYGSFLDQRPPLIQIVAGLDPDASNLLFRAGSG